MNTRIAIAEAILRRAEEAQGGMLRIHPFLVTQRLIANARFEALIEATRIAVTVGRESEDA